MGQQNFAHRMAVLSAHVREADAQLRDAIRRARRAAVRPLQKQWRIDNVLSRTDVRARPAGVLPDVIADLAQAGVSREELRLTIGAAVDRMIIEATPAPPGATTQHRRRSAAKESHEAGFAILVLEQEESASAREMVAREVREALEALDDLLADLFRPTQPTDGCALRRA